MKHTKQWGNCKKCAPMICENIWEAKSEIDKIYIIDGHDFRINPHCIGKNFDVSFSSKRTFDTLLEAFDYVLNEHKDIQLQDYLNILKCKAMQEEFINGKEKLNENN